MAQNGHKVIAVENKKGPFENLERNIKENQLENLSCVLKDGLDYLPKEVDCCCLLGMGGNTILEILSWAKERLPQFSCIIVEPQSNPSCVISFLLDSGFYNDQGLYVYERRYYPLLRFVPGKEETDLLERKYGPFPVKNKDSLLLEMLRKERDSLIPFSHIIENRKEIEKLNKEIKTIQHETQKTS